MVGRGGWYNDQPNTMNITCKSLGIIFEIWSADYVQENMDVMMDEVDGGGDENGDGEA
jgi:hypothetical protein